MTDPQNSPEALGSRYLLDAPLGAGAMGQVWRGRTRENEPLAIKVLRPELSSDPAVVARFVQEAQILTRLDDPHLVRVHDLVAEGSRLAIVMDLVEGPDLRTELARRGTFRPIEAADIIDGVLAGLAAVHAGGVVHRDVKPENVLLGGGLPGDARLTDFGIASIVEESQKSRRTTVIGTPEYLAPEVADGAAPTAASDLYAVGIMFYELVAGVTPFSGGSPLAVLRRHAEQQPVRPEGMPDGIWVAVTSLLAKDPAQRAPSAAEFRTWLAAAAPGLAGAPALRPLEAPPVPVAVHQPTVMGGRSETQPVPTPAGATRSPRGRTRRKWPVVLAALLVLLLAAGAAAVIIAQPFDGGGGGGGAAGSPSPSDTASPSPRTTTPSRTTASAQPTGSLVPAVTGLTLASAQSAVANAKLRVRVTEILDETVPDNTVTAQDPAEGTELDGGDEVLLTVARRPVAVFLSRITPVSTSLDSAGTGAVRLNGGSYIHALTARTRCDSSVGADYDLGRHYRTLTASLGVTDDSDSAGVVQFDVVLDGRTIFSQTSKLGAPIPLTVDVTGGLRLELRATRIEVDCEDYYNRVSAVWADPQIFGAPGEVPSPTATPTA